MELIPFDSFPPMQQRILQHKLDNNYITYTKWIETVKNTEDYQFYPKSLGRFILRSAMGYIWTPHNETGGNLPYLCPADFQELKNQTHEMCVTGTNYIEQNDFIDLATSLKTERILKAARFLRTINCPKFAEFLADATELDPSRQWMQSSAEELGLEFVAPKHVEETRVDAASLRLNMKFLIDHEEIISDCPPPLMFGADETMLKTLMKKKVLALINSGTKFRKAQQIPHITSMCTHNVVGDGPPPFIILSNTLKSLPQELIPLAQAEKAWFASSKSGWMTRDLFIVWTILFINWLTRYRKQLSVSIRDRRALLILDGHASRECPVALHLLRENDVDVLCLPAHTSHITQMFDVCLASPLKRKYSDLLRVLINEVSEKETAEGQTSTLRYCACEALISSWESIRTYTSCRRTAATCGYCPFNPDKIKESPYVIERTEDEDNQYLARRAARTRLDINGRLINTPDFVDYITNRMTEHPHLTHLTHFPPPGTPWRNICEAYLKNELPNHCTFLSKISYFVSRAGHVIYF